jgi:hypothetical protein
MPNEPGSENAVVRLFRNRRLRKWIGEPLRLLKNGHELLVIVLFYAAVAGIHFGGADVEATYDWTRLAKPSKLDAALTTTDPAPAEVHAAAARISNSQSLLTITIRNDTSNRISNMEVVVHTVEDIADVAVSSTSAPLTDRADKIAIYKSLSSGDLWFPNLTELPPKSEIKLLLWGNIGRPLLSDPVTVRAPSTQIIVSEVAVTAGLGLFFARYSGAIVFLVASYYLIVMLRRVRDQEDAGAADS